MVVTEFQYSHLQCQTIVRPLTQQCKKVWSYLHTIPLKPDFARLWKSSLIAMSDVWPFFYRKLVLSSAVELIHIVSISCMADCRWMCEQHTVCLFHNSICLTRCSLVHLTRILSPKLTADLPHVWILACVSRHPARITWRGQHFRWKNYIEMSSLHHS